MRRAGVDLAEVDLDGMKVPRILGLKLQIRKFRKTHHKVDGGWSPEDSDELFRLERELKLAQMSGNRGSDA